MNWKLLFFSFLLLFVASCKHEQPKQEVYNPFATPEGCVKEYLDARDSCDMVRMLKCFSYEAKFESLIREHLQKQIDKKKWDDNYYKEHYPDYYYKTDSIKMTEEYPNSAVVTVYYTDGYTKDKISPGDYTMNLVKDSTNWKIEVRFSWGISAQ